MRLTTVSTLRCAALAAAALAGAAASGCIYPSSARMWADSALAGGRFSTKDEQWVYDGEPATFELECDPGAVHFVVFGVDGDETVVNIDEVEGRYRWRRAFHCGARPRTLEVYAIPFLIRGRCDWVYDKVKDTWTYYPGRTEKPDVQTAPEQTIRVTVYRTTVHFRFEGRGGPPPECVLTLTRADGEETEIAGGLAPGPDNPFDVAGPEDGVYRLAYTPTHEQVSRAGTTHAVLCIRHADGSIERMEQDVETP
ncbi:MAG: hypothetical protein R6X20_07870 [Phycisphaerae bacterium]